MTHRHLIPKAINPLHQLRVMERLVRRTAKKPGSSPGTLIHTGPQKMERVRIRFLDYDVDHLEEADPSTIDDCFHLKDLPTVSWINVDGLHDISLLEKVGQRFGWHPLMLEDIVSVGQRAKVEEYDDAVFVVLPMLGWDAERQQVREEQLSLILGENYVFTFQEREGDVFDEVRERIRMQRGRIRKSGPDYLAYALMDAVVDHYFKALEGIGDLTESLEGEVLLDPKEQTMHMLHSLKRELIAVRRSIWPLRDMMNVLLRGDNGLFSSATRIYLRDVHDHTVQVLDTVEALRDVSSGMVDLYLSTVSFRTNEIMKVLTIMASIFIPLTFLAGVYGMNFEYMPELHLRWAYPTLLGVMAAMGLGMVVYFKRKGWF